MTSQSHIPGYENLITETLYQSDVDYATCGKAECNVINPIPSIITPNSIQCHSKFPYQSHIKSPYKIEYHNPNQYQNQCQTFPYQQFDSRPYFVKEKDGPFIPAYHSQQYKTDIPYKGAIFNPCIVTTQETHKKCNPLVAYAYGVPQDVKYEKCTKCKGSIKCATQKKHTQKQKGKITPLGKNEQRNENENEMQTEMEIENEKENEREGERESENTNDKATEPTLEMLAETKNKNEDQIEGEKENLNEELKKEPQMKNEDADSCVEINDDSNFFTYTVKENENKSLREKWNDAEKDIAKEQKKNIQLWDVLDKSKINESLKLNSNELISHPSNFKESFFSPCDKNGKTNRHGCTNDMEYTFPLNFNSNFPVSNGNSTNDLFSSNCSHKMDSPYLSQGAQNSYTNIKNMKFVKNMEKTNYDDVISSHDIDSNNNTMNTHKPLYLKVNGQYVRLYDNIHTDKSSAQKQIIIEKLDPDRYDLGFNPFTTELNSNTIKMYNKNYNNGDTNNNYITAATTLNNSSSYHPSVNGTYPISSNDENEAVRQNSISQKKGHTYLQKQGKKQERNRESEDTTSKKEWKEGMTEWSELQSELYHMNTASNKSEKQKVVGKKILLNLRKENDLAEKDILTKRSLKKKKNVMGTENNLPNKNKRAEKSHSKVAKLSNVRFDMPTKRRQKRICKLEQMMMEEQIKNTNELKSKTDSTYSMKIMTTTADDLFSPLPNRRVVTDKRKVVKNSSYKDFKSKSMSRISIGTSRSPSRRKAENYNLKAKVANSIKNINTTANKKKELQKGKVSADEIAKISDIQTLIKNKKQINDLNKKNGNKPQTIGTVGERNNAIGNREVEKKKFVDDKKSTEHEENNRGEERKKRKEKKIKQEAEEEEVVKEEEKEEEEEKEKEEEEKEEEEEEEEEKEEEEEEEEEKEEKEKEEEEDGKGTDTNTTEKPQLLLMRSTTKFYGDKKPVPFKSIHVRSYSINYINQNNTVVKKNGESNDNSNNNNNSNNPTNKNTELIQRKGTLKLKKMNTMDKKKKVETGKNKTNLDVLNTEPKETKRGSINGKLKSKKKELYANILSITKNMKPKEATEESIKRSKEKLQISLRSKEEIQGGSKLDNELITPKSFNRKNKYLKEKSVR